MGKEEKKKSGKHSMNTKSKKEPEKTENRDKIKKEIKKEEKPKKEIKEKEKAKKENKQEPKKEEQPEIKEQPVEINENEPNEAGKVEKKNKVKKEIQSEFEKKLEIPEELARKINGQMLKNMFIAVCVCAYYAVITLGYKNISQEIFIVDLRVFAGSLLITCISLFESSYKRDSGKLCIHGIEVLYMAIVTLFMPYMFFYYNEIVRIVLPTMCIIAIVVYYFIKALIIEYKMTNEYKKSLSDIKEIIEKK